MDTSQSKTKLPALVRIRKKIKTTLNYFHKELFRINPKLGWFISQIGERKYWRWRLKGNQKDDGYLKMILEYFELEENQDFGDKIFIDIGSGPIGILRKIKARRRIAVDPIPINKNDKTIERICSPGENIPLPDEFADGVFIYNVLQHVMSPEKVLNEGKRTLKKGGTFYILEELNVPTNVLHPHSLKLEMFEKWILQNDFEIIKKEKEEDCTLRTPKSAPGSGIDILCLILKKK